ncbi:DNA-directed RNA polymerase II subunit [Wickerhamomyces ciferrii]|uniref:DNA-directed RNA polymerase II subunit n=1 Tax=Wickerhamomyces ciferrii (strain ATCC 14091 / BCRC 22168 / CBS 111 / JCM 3599 / NBRC 0793 / NRRL Y-1031 F-60-10) TaxID=1206466 RepID=K0KUV9_WICCF|nr:DNA-directed RNA polymerase II subunit [Wickerhamomyces ciferrii]CCH47016.1 DNA-directed RNA polymerase II subunit [Wickerhamomyces ciferrii]
MSEPPHSNLTRSLSTFKSKISSKFKNNSDQLDNSVDEDGIFAMKYDDFNKEEEQSIRGSVEIRPSASFTNLNNHELIQSSRNCSIDAGNPLESTSSTPPPLSQSQSQSQQPSSPSTTQFSLKEKEFSFLQLQNSSSPITSKRSDSIIDPLNTSILSDKLNMAVNSIPSSDIVSPQPRSIPPSITHNNSIVSSTSRKSSNISTSSNFLPPLQQPITPTNEIPLSHKILEAQSLELADAMALSILDKVDAGIKIDQNVETEWKI